MTNSDLAVGVVQLGAFDAERVSGKEVGRFGGRRDPEDRRAQGVAQMIRRSGGGDASSVEDRDVFGIVGFFEKVRRHENRSALLAPDVRQQV